MNFKRILRESIVSILIISLFGASYAALSGLKATQGEALTTAKWNALVDAAVPTGFVGSFNLSTCPTGWSIADGTNGNPDLRGQFIRGLNDFGSGLRSDGNEDPDGAGRALGSQQGDAIRNITGTIKMSNPNQAGNGVFSTIGTAGSDINTWSATPSTSVVFDVSTVVPTAGDNRPKNIALLYCVKD